MRAILIDPFTKTVTERDLKDVKNQTIYKEIERDCFDIANIGSGVVVFVDDLGLKRKDQQFWFFDHPGGGVLMAGKGLMLSVDRMGKTRELDYRVGLQGVRDIVHFVGGGTDVDQAMEAGILDRPEITINGAIIWTWTPKEQVL